MVSHKNRFQVSGFRCQEIWVFGIRYSAFDTDTSYETTLECRMSNVE
ncbi:hypothetical protein D1AOALGA4SA_11610 [Olavius algarvensis Delta 1 endosymbiont]|nr:hypothetical protein D1AOALGA4SA_11610 [Olavius algarvensis Delta 1 endosymbiont]